MAFKKYSTEGIVLARRNYSEADRILVIFTKDLGKLGLIAKGVRKPKSRKRAHIEIFNKVKFSLSRGYGLDVMTEAEVVEAYSDLKKDLKKVAVAYFFMEMVGRMVREGERNEELYGELNKFLDRLRGGENLRNLRREFILRALVILGFWPKGKKLDDPDRMLEEILERTPSSVRVGKRILQ